MKLLSVYTMILLGISTTVYAGWTKYVFGDGQVPKGDCLEMMCEYGCIERESGHNFEGKCCPAGNLGENCYGGICPCSGEMRCIQDMCSCPVGFETYTTYQNEPGCCDKNDSLLFDVPGGQACCPKITPKWDGSAKKCVECLNNSDCADKGYNLSCLDDKTCGCAAGYVSNIQSNGKIACCPSNKPKWDESAQKCVECLTDTDCEGEQVCAPNKTCGCANGTTRYTKLDQGTGCCNERTNKLLTVSSGQVCCPNATPKWYDSEKRCVLCLTDEDCKGDLVCLPNKTCGCARGYTVTPKGNGQNTCCPNDRPYWLNSGSQCVECTKDEHCAQRTDGKIFCDTRSYRCTTDPCEGYDEGACPAAGICDCCPARPNRCNLKGCQNGYHMSGRACVANPCPGYDWLSCPAGSSCSVCLSGSRYLYKVVGCQNGYRFQSGSCVYACSGYNQVNCGACEICQKCPYGNRYRFVGCQSSGNCCRTNSGGCGYCARVWHI